MPNELVTASFMVMVLRKANIIFGCIKRSILYKTRGGDLFFIALMCTATRHLVLAWEGGTDFQANKRGPFPRRGCRHFLREQPISGLRMEMDLGLYVWRDSGKGSLRGGGLLVLQHEHLVTRPLRPQASVSSGPLDVTSDWDPDTGHRYSLVSWFLRELLFPPGLPAQAALFICFSPRISIPLMSQETVQGTGHLPDVLHRNRLFVCFAS